MASIYKKFLEDLGEYNSADLRLSLFSAACNGSVTARRRPAIPDLMPDVWSTIHFTDFPRVGRCFKTGGTSSVHQEERKMIDFSKPVQTEGGKPVRILSQDGTPARPIVGLIGDNLYTWPVSGVYYEYASSHALDLENVPEKRTVYVNVYKQPDGLKTGGSYPTREAADSAAHFIASRAGCMKVELVEGQYDE